MSRAVEDVLHATHGKPSGGSGGDPGLVVWRRDVLRLAATALVVLVAPLAAGCVARGRATGDTGDSLPSWLPEPPVVDGSEPFAGGDFIIGATYDEPSFVFAVTPEGEWVWAHQVESGRLAVQAAREVDGTGIRTTTFDAGLVEPVGQGLVLAGDGRTLDEVELPWAHHVFLQHDDGTLAWLALDIREWTDPETGEVGTVVGDALYELSPDGTQRLVSTPWDWLEVEPNDGWLLSLYPQGHDWTHANSVFYDLDRDSYLVGFYQLDSVVELARSDGAPVRWWTAAPELPAPDDADVLVLDDAFHHPHDANLTDDGTLLMVSTQQSTHAVEFSFGDGVLEEVWRWGEALDEVSSTLGQARRLPGGESLYLNTVDGILRQVSVDDTQSWSMDFGMRVGQVQVVDALSGERLLAEP